MVIIVGRGRQGRDLYSFMVDIRIHEIRQRGNIRIFSEQTIQCLKRVTSGPM